MTALLWVSLAAAGVVGGGLIAATVYKRRARVGADGMPTLVFGAGEAGRQIIKSIQRRHQARWTIVGVLDDDVAKHGTKICGAEVLGDYRDLTSIASRTSAEALIVATPAFSETTRKVTAKAVDLGLRVKVVPDIEDLLSHDIDVRVVRDVRVQDLLGRRERETNVSDITRYLEGKRVLIAGAGGSIGSELCRQICRWSPEEVIMLDRDESALLSTQLAVYKRPHPDDVDVILADIRDPTELARVFAARRPHIVFHAAALKHVVTLEKHPREALKTNVIGTLNLLNAAAASNVERFVNISTDKAADPASVLGYSKRISEGLTAHVAAETGFHYVSVRFGNVLGSRGSVLSTFLTQIAEGVPITITAPEASRYFITPEEATQLVIRAGVTGQPGEVLILDMGDPVRIIDLARKVLSQLDQEHQIEFTGLKEGEKTTEILFGSGESDNRPSHPLISHVQAPPVDPRECVGIDLQSTSTEVIDSLQGICAGMAERMPQHGQSFKIAHQSEER